MPTEAPRGPGRPSKGKRGTFTFRVTAGLRERLEAAAAASDYSISEEIERRLEQSFNGEDTLTAAFGGPELRSHALGLVVAFTRGGESAARGRSPAKWLRDPNAYRAAMIRALKTMLIDVPHITVEEAATLRGAFDQLLKQALFEAGEIKLKMRTTDRRTAIIAHNRPPGRA